MTTMVEWLAPTFNHHKKRLIGAVRGSHQSQLYLDKIRETHEAGKLPHFIASLDAPKALDGLPSLQTSWDQIHTQYKKSLYQALVSSREEKLATQYSPAIRDEIIKSLVGDTKRVTAEKSAADPAHKATFEAEGKAAFSLFTSSITAWEQEAREQALSSFQKQRAIKEANESNALEDANVSDSKLIGRNNTDTLKDTHHHPLPTGPQIPTLSSKGHLSAQGRKGQRCSTTTTKGHIQAQLQRSLKRQRNSNKGKGNVNTIQSSPTLHTSYTNLKPKNRRLSKAQKNKIKHTNNTTHDLKIEMAELQIMKHNLKEIGVAQKLVHNLTGKTIPAGALNCLALGTKFISVPKPNSQILPLSIKNFRRTIRLRHIFQDDENNIIPQYWQPSSWNPPFLDQRRDIETTINTLQNSIQPSTNQIPSNINRRDITQYNKLLYDDNTLVILADKNLGYAVVTKSWYIERCLDHLNSPSYTNVTETYHKGIHGKTTINYLLDSLADLITKYQYQLGPDEIKWILQKPQDQWEPMRFYITAKVHKKPVKGRPIVPSMTWMTFHLSQWLANQLNPLLTSTEWVLKDSYDLLASLKQLNDLPHTIRVATADVDALYPSMDINTGLTLIKDFIEELDWENPQKREFLLKAMEFVLTKGFITFQDQIYQQTNGAAMGSPMIPPYANIFMYQLEKQTVHKFTNSGMLLLYKRFIDDVFILTKDSNITELQNELNNLHPSINLSWSSSAKHCNFLDIVVSIKNNKLSTSVYQKQLNTYAYLPFHSYHTTAQKRGFIKGEAIRYARICTNESDFKLMVRLFTLRLQRRGYPLSFIHKALGQVQHIDRQKYTVKTKSTNNSNTKTIPLLFKTEYNPIVSHHNLRTSLNQFTANIIKLANIHPSISQKVTICYKMPPKLHRLSLKARKRKGL